MPGLPVEIEPESEIVTEILNEKLSEVSPVTEDTIPDLDVDETTKTGILDGLENFDDGEDEREEPLNEAEPPEEDEIEDTEPPDKRINEIMGDQDIGSDQESDSEGDEDEVIQDETDSGLPGTDVDKVENETDTETFKTVTEADGTNSDNEQGRTEGASGEVDNQTSSDVDIKRDSSEEFQDAPDKLEGESSDLKESKDRQVELKEDIDSSDKLHEKDKDLHDDHEGTPVDPVEHEGDSNSLNRVTDIDHNANIENQSVDDDSADVSKRADVEPGGQDDVEQRSDVTVTGLRTSTAETV